MKMKRMFIAVLTLVTFAMLAGCNNLEEATITNASSGELRTVSIGIANIPTDYAAMIASGASEYGARTILPDNPYNTASEGLVWLLSGSSSSGKTYAPTKLTVVADDASGATATAQLVALEAYVWELTLTAYKAQKSGNDYLDESGATTTDPTKYAADLTKPVLVGYTSLDLRTSASSVTTSFNMIKTGLDTAGTVQIKGLFKDGIMDGGNVKNSVVAYYKIGLYDRVTGDKIADVAKTTGSSTVYAECKVEKDGASGATYTYTADSTDKNYWAIQTGGTQDAFTVAPGTYLFAIDFYNDNDVRVGYYSDNIVVDPGYPLIQNLGKIDVVNQKPEAPSAFKAYLVNDSEGSIEGFYKVRFEWVDNSSNETNFEIELLEAGGEAPRQITNNPAWHPTTATTSSGNYTYNATAKTWTYTADVGTGAAAVSVTDTIRLYGLNATNAFATDLYGSDFWSSGTLRAGSKTLTMYLSLGKVYEARIRAINSSGASDWVERTTTGGAASSILTGTTGYNYAGYTDSKQHINRLKIEYDLNGAGATLYKDADDTYNGKYTEYDTYGTDATDKELLYGVDEVSSSYEITLKEYKESGTEYPTISSSLGKFVYWSDKTDSTHTQLNVHTYKNLTALAIYDFTATITVNGYNELSKELITFACYEEATCTTDVPNAVTTGTPAKWKTGVAYSTDNSTWVTATPAVGDDTYKYATLQSMHTDSTTELTASNYLKVTVDNTDEMYDRFKFVIANSIATDTVALYEGEDTEFKVDLGNYDAGVYMIRILAKDKNYTNVWYSAGYITTISNTIND